MGLPVTFTRRGLGRLDAATYVGLDPAEFDRRVARGLLPGPKRIDDEMVVWDRWALDRPPERRRRPRALPPPRPESSFGFVYFIGFGGYVKIGFTSTSVEARVRDLQIGSPEKLVIYARVPGSKQDEHNLHKRFRALRTNGEWFRHEGALADHIKALSGG